MTLHPLTEARIEAEREAYFRSIEDVPKIHCEICGLDVPVTDFSADVNADVYYKLESTDRGFRFVKKEVNEFDNTDYRHAIYDTNGDWKGTCETWLGWDDLERAIGADPWS